MIQDPIGDDAFRCRTDSLTAPVDVEHLDGVLFALEADARRATSFATMRSRSFALSFSAARVVAPLSAENPISLVVRFARGPSDVAMPARRSGVGSRCRVNGPSRRSFSLLGPPATRKSETAAAET